jgi:glycosyltransferase involved in cell wall biosynthesis
MKILFLHHFDLDLAGGSGVYLRTMLPQLRAQGHEVAVAAAADRALDGTAVFRLPFPCTPTFGPEARPGEVTFDDLSRSELEHWSEAACDWLGTAVLEAFSPDLVLVNHICILARTAQLAQQRFGLPYRILSYGTDTELMARNGRYVELFGPAARRAERVFTISRMVAAEIESLLPGAVVEVLGGAVDARLFYPPAEWGDPGPVATFVGRLVTEKGLWVLLDALRRQRHLEELHIIGEGPLAAAIRREVAGNGLPVRVRMRGYVPQSALRAALLESGLLIVPSIWQEPLGLVSLEAIACGVPVVASAVGGIPEIVEDGVNGILVTPGDAAALASAIDRVFGSEEVRRRLTAGCRETRIPSYGDIARSVVR